MTELLSDPANDGCHVKTSINVSTYAFNWTMENFSKFPVETEQKSPIFHPLPNHSFNATFTIAENIQPFLKFRLISGTRIKVKHIVSIKNIAGQVVLDNITTHTYDNTSDIHDVLPGCSSIMKRAREENVMILKCIMEFYDEEVTDTYFYEHQKPVVSVLDDLSALSNELKAIYDKVLYADVTLKVGDSVMRVHKLIICARSSVFARMFETPMGEKEENVIDITDLKLQVLKDLVSYLYSGVLVKNDFESVYALYYGADKYDVPSLRKKCAGILLSELDVENASRVLVLADRHSDVELKNSVIDFIKVYHYKVLETDTWDELVKNAPRLATEVFCAWGKNRNKVKSDTK